MNNTGSQPVQYQVPKPQPNIIIENSVTYGNVQPTYVAPPQVGVPSKQVKPNIIQDKKSLSNEEMSLIDFSDITGGASSAASTSAPSTPVATHQYSYQHPPISPAAYQVPNSAGTQYYPQAQQYSPAQQQFAVPASQYQQFQQFLQFQQQQVLKQ